MLIPDTLPVIATERMTLRALADADLPALFAMHADTEAMRYWSGPPMRDPAEAVALLERSRADLAAQRALRWALAERGTDECLGTCTLFSFHVSNRRAEIGYLLARPRWGSGLMHEALSAVCDYAFGTLALHRLEGDVDPRNSASVRALERLGFAREGLLRERWRLGDEVSDTLFMGLLARDWRARTPGPAA